MGAISESLGQGVEIEFKGEKYTMAPWDLDIQGAFEKYIEGEIIAGARRMGQLLPQEEALAVLAKTAEKIGLKRYTFGTPEMGEALSSPVHMEYMLYLMLKRGNSKVTRELVRAMAKEMWGELIRASNQANGVDPNAQAPETETSTNSTAGA